MLFAYKVRFRYKSYLSVWIWNNVSCIETGVNNKSVENDKIGSVKKDHEALEILVIHWLHCLLVLIGLIAAFPV